MRRLLSHRFRIEVIFALCLAVSAGIAQTSSAQQPSAGTLEGYKAHLSLLSELVSACNQNPSVCDPAKVGGNDRVPARDGKAAFEVHWSWLWDLILKAKDPKLADREKLLRAAGERLQEQMREAGVEKSAPRVDFKNARSSADKVLAASEFRRVTGNGLRDRLVAKFFDWFSRIFGGVSTFARGAPWLGPVIMYGFLLLAFAGLVVWIFRILDRQRLAVRMEPGAAITHSQETSRSWAKLAEAAAASGEWREAVHALYWASISELEARRVWRANNVRTPREYLRLVSPDAPQYRPLRALTRSLERIWYGFAPAVREDYDAALAVYEELRSA
ncbi:DUF4129 domain-containing protein [Granulicella aggregans]|jgi:hypothetical protein|uniref:DUF4129 domain-containing protein n=1 Tax=Granulicella aggregans TaxID=474949 RepID=UPI0021DFD545|nr:DUF4129 domain-containing protein [Granulicella aggregans]